jgi:peptide/nickel transport system permease protein
VFVDEDTQVEIPSRRQRAVRGIRRHVITPLRIILADPRGALGMLIVGTYTFMATLGPAVVRAPGANQADQLLKPFENMTYPLGTDALGQDLLALLIYATPSMFQMILAGGLFATGMAVVVGTFAGYTGGRWDEVLMTFNDVAMTIPGLPLIIVLAGVFEPESPYVIGFLLTINAWAGLARAIRSQVLPLRDAEYVEASRSMGLSTRRIIVDDILPNVMPYILISFMNTSRQVIYNSVALYFLGILPFTLLNWGVIINLAHEQGALASSTMWHWLLLPIITIVVLSLGTVLLAQSTDRIFNPRVRAKHDKETETTTAELGG